MKDKKTSQGPAPATVPKNFGAAPHRLDSPPDFSTAGNLSVQQLVRGAKGQIAPESHPLILATRGPHKSGRTLTILSNLVQQTARSESGVTVDMMET